MTHTLSVAHTQCCTHTQCRTHTVLHTHSYAQKIQSVSNQSEKSDHSVIVLYPMPVFFLHVTYHCRHIEDVSLHETHSMQQLQLLLLLLLCVLVVAATITAAAALLRQEDSSVVRHLCSHSVQVMHGQLAE